MRYVRKDRYVTETKRKDDRKMEFNGNSKILCGMTIVGNTITKVAPWAVLSYFFYLCSKPTRS